MKNSFLIFYLSELTFFVIVFNLYLYNTNYFSYKLKSKEFITNIIKIKIYSELSKQLALHLMTLIVIHDTVYNNFRIFLLCCTVTHVFAHEIQTLVIISMYNMATNSFSLSTTYPATLNDYYNFRSLTGLQA